MPSPEVVAKQMYESRTDHHPDNVITYSFDCGSRFRVWLYQNGSVCESGLIERCESRGVLCPCWDVAEAFDALAFPGLARTT